MQSVSAQRCVAFLTVSPPLTCVALGLHPSVLLKQLEGEPALPSFV